MDLVTPRTYIPTEVFQKMPNDYDLTPYTSVQLQGLLVRATGSVDAYMKRTLLATEVTEQKVGDGSNLMYIDRFPIIYIKNIQFVLPGMQGYQVPVSQILIDYNVSELLNYTPLVFQGIGLTTVFPRGTPITITYGYGMGYAVPSPSFTTKDVAPTTGTPLAPGTYYTAVSSQTMWGESQPTITPVTTATGAIQYTLTPVPGAYIYNVYLGTSNSPSALTRVAQSPSTNYGSQPLAVTVSSLAPPNGLFAQVFPASDSSAYPIPPAVIEATRLTALDMLWAQNNLANRGIAMQRSGDKDIRWRSTEGNSGRGVSYVTQQVQELLSPYKLQSVF